VEENLKYLEVRGQIPRAAAALEDWEDLALCAKLSHTLR